MADLEQINVTQDTTPVTYIWMVKTDYKDGGITYSHFKTRESAEHHVNVLYRNYERTPLCNHSTLQIFKVVGHSEVSYYTIEKFVLFS